jgi:hypothetical protein
MMAMELSIFQKCFGYSDSDYVVLSEKCCLAVQFDREVEVKGNHLVSY